MVASELSYDIPVGVEVLFDDMRGKMSYTHAVARKTHSFGMTSWWPKLSGFNVGYDVPAFNGVKWRPTGSYFKHKFNR